MTNKTANSRVGLMSLLVKPSKQRTSLARLIGLKLFLFAVVIAVVWFMRAAGLLHIDNVLRYRQTEPVAAVLIFIGIYALSVIVSLPTLPLNVAAGALWGPVLGGIIAVAGMVLGACVAFGCARFLFGQPLAERFDSNAIRWLQSEFDTQGWRFIAFLRLNPVFPTGPLNYILGLTSIDTFTYMWATFVFLLPPGIAVAVLGHSMGLLFDAKRLQSGIYIAVLISAAVTVLVAIRYVSKYFTSRLSDDNHSSSSNVE